MPQHVRNKKNNNTAEDAADRFAGRGIFGQNCRMQAHNHGEPNYGKCYDEGSRTAIDQNFENRFALIRMI
ncbi:hypothetical protein KC219_28520, partial [Mycobacterium tuberculosis]|nr:hypothetical protein [Mycobacterium tuberculosis]